LTRSGKVAQRRVRWFGSSVSPAELTRLSSREFLDTDDQELLVRSYEEANEKAVRTWKFCFTVICGFLGVFYTYSSVYEALLPGNLAYHRVYREYLSSGSVAAADGVAAVTILLLTAFLLSSRRRLLQIAAALSLGICVIGCFCMVRMTPADRLRAAWQPCVPLTTCVLVWYLEKEFKGIASEISKLRDAMYQFKCL